MVMMIGANSEASASLDCIGLDGEDQWDGN